MADPFVVPTCSQRLSTREWAVVRRGKTKEETLSGWGRLAAPGREIVGEDLAALTQGMPLSRGLGRSYGDASLPPAARPVVVGTRLADRILEFDSTSGMLKAEAGLSLRSINELFLPRGWASPVLPGTQDITIGGMVAADVHGKNHHVDGTFGQYVECLSVRLPARKGDRERVVSCSREHHDELFRATLGGMGLTGHILEVDVRLQPIPSPWVWAETEAVSNLDAFLAALDRAAADWPFTMGWIDSLKQGRSMGRGIIYRGRWATAEEAPTRSPSVKKRLQVPLEFPLWVLSKPSVRLFNLAIFRKHPPWVRRGIMHPEGFFHPLDVLGNWNRIYGRRGFTQYQCVLPRREGHRGVHRFMERLTQSGAASFLSVIKNCGDEGEGLLSFPRRGTTVALDLPVRDGTQNVIDRLNQTVLEEGGRIYLAKDAFTRAHDFAAMDPRLPAWLRIRDQYDPERRLASALSVRLFGDTPAGGPR